jgi:hypothetical protein
VQHLHHGPLPRYVRASDRCRHLSGLHFGHGVREPAALHHRIQFAVQPVRYGPLSCGWARRHVSVVPGAFRM